MLCAVPLAGRFYNSVYLEAIDGRFPETGERDMEKLKTMQKEFETSGCGVYNGVGSCLNFKNLLMNFLIFFNKVLH